MAIFSSKESPSSSPKRKTVPPGSEKAKRTTPSTTKVKLKNTATPQGGDRGLSDKQNIAKKKGMAERAAEQLKEYFPEVPAKTLWIRQKNKGFTTIPRTMPNAMELIDALSAKGQPAGHTYFSLWCRAPDGPLVVIQNTLTFAAEAGFSGERAVDTWRRRMRKLRELGFIKTKPGVSGEFHYVLLMNPNVVMKLMEMRGNPAFKQELYFKFRDRITDIGAQADLRVAEEILEAAAEQHKEE